MAESMDRRLQLAPGVKPDVLSRNRICVKQPRPALRGDDSGAVMVIGVFLAMVVTGAMFYIVGVGNTIIYRERMQDAADAVAFSGAVMNAKGLNLVALINIVMALLTAIWIAMEVVKWMLDAAMIACSTVLYFVCFGLTPVINTAEMYITDVANAYQNDVLTPALRLGHSAEELIRTAWPILAEGRVLAATLSGAYRPPVDAGSLLPVGTRPLPITPVTLNRTCQHAGEYLGELVTLPLSLPILDPIRSVISAFLGQALAALTCPTDQTDERPYEIDPGSGDCTDGMPGQDCEYVQIRSAVYSSHTPFSGNEQGVQVAAWGQGVGRSALSMLEPFTHISVAQAEYYYEGTESIDEWTWHMYWRARMRRFRISSAITGVPGLSGVDFSTVAGLIVH